MPSSEAKPVTIALSDTSRVSGLLQGPAEPRACLVLAHGAGAGMTHPSLTAVAKELAERGIASLRYQFPYMEQGGKRPDPPKVAHATVRAAVAEAVRLLPGTPLFAGGRSFGGRMTSQAQALSPLPGVLGLAFLGFPLHPAGKPSRERATHLFDVEILMLFLQGTRDALALLDELEPVCRELGERATLRLFEDADHSFHVPARTGRNDAQVRGEMLDALAEWIDRVLSQRR
jgi:predicted alpha/beta-hydrolase family hydrolase